MISQYSGYEISNRKGLDHWAPILEEFSVVVERFSRVMGGNDGVYLYTEMTAVGALAAAAWRCGQAAIEEYQQDKGKDEKRGRADLYITSDFTEDFIEAKYKWLSSPMNKNSLDTLNDSLNRALDDVKQVQDVMENHSVKGVTKYIGVSFHPLYVSKTVSNKEEYCPDELIEQAISAAKESKAHAIAWCFPQSMRNYKSHSGRFNPGLIMLVSNLGSQK